MRVDRALLQLARGPWLLPFVLAAVLAQGEPTDTAATQDHEKSAYPPLFSPRDDRAFFESLLAVRQNQGIGGGQSGQPDGVPFVPNVPFANNDSLPYSPPRYPTPQVQGTGAWAEPVRKAREFIQKFDLEQRVKLVTGVGWQQGPCVGNIAGIDELDWPGLCLQDSPLGVRFADNVNVYPAGVTSAATFDGSLDYKKGRAMGTEFRLKGVNIQLGPGMNFHKYAAGGRNWEMAGADPYLAGESAFNLVKGIQSVGVQACAKHYIGNEQEHFRNEGSSNIDSRTLRELYLHPFMRSVQADVASVMASYNFVNNSWAAQNSYLLNDVLMTELGFQGFVVSDWGAQHSGVASANAGLTMTMPGDELCCFTGQNSSFWGHNLTTAVNNGSVEASRLEDMGVRILAAWYLLGQDDPNYPKPNFDSFDQTAPINKHLNVNKVHRPQKLIREIGAAGTVLVKNKKKKNGFKALPLKKQNGHTPNRISIVGSDAGPAHKGANEFADRGGVDGTLGIGWGSGSADYSYLVSPYEALQRRAIDDGTAFHWSFDDFDLARAKTISDERRGVDASIVFVQSDSGEGYLTVDGNAGDRNNLTAWHKGNDLIKAVASVQSNTIVVIHSPGQLDVEAWVDHPNVTAILFAHMPGAESGNAITDVLYGDYNPSGRLPYTVAKNRSDYGVEVTYVNRTDTPHPQVNYTEGLLVDYRHFDAKGIEPRYEFGFGLSYTNFEYDSLQGHWLNGAQRQHKSSHTAGSKEQTHTQHSRDPSSKAANTGHPHASAHRDHPKAKTNGTGHFVEWSLPEGSRAHSSGLPASLFTDIYELSFNITNTGNYSGHEVPQGYLVFPESAGEPPKVLRRFDRVWVPKGQTKQIKWKLNRYDLSVWNSVVSKWVRPEGDFEIWIGSSSRKMKLKQKL
ncbi:unnamed protein product [Parajaminaea phylloscopi]